MARIFWVRLPGVSTSRRCNCPRETRVCCGRYRCHPRHRPRHPPRPRRRRRPRHPVRRSRPATATAPAAWSCTPTPQRRCSATTARTLQSPPWACAAAVGRAPADLAASNPSVVTATMEACAVPSQTFVYTAAPGIHLGGGLLPLRGGHQDGGRRCIHCHPVAPALCLQRQGLRRLGRLRLTQYIHTSIYS